jgi:hypothetical protein
LLEHLKAFRDQRLAHYDSDISKDTSITFGQVRQLIDDVKDIYNSLSRGHERSVTSFDRISRDAEWHTSEVIRIMCEERDRAKLRIQEAEKEKTRMSETKKASWGSAFTTAFIVAAVNFAIYLGINLSDSAKYAWQEIGALLMSVGAFIFLVYMMREILSRSNEDED